MRFEVTAAVCSQGRSQRFRKRNRISTQQLGEFVEAFDQANKVSQIPLPKTKFEIGFTKAKDKLFSQCYKDIVEHLNRQIRLSFRFEKIKTCVFSITKFEHYGDQFILTEVVDMGYREIKHLYKNRFFVANNINCPITQCSGKLCLHRRIFESLGRSDYQCPQCASVCHVRNIPFKDQKNSFFVVVWSRGLHFSRKSKFNSRYYRRCVLSAWYCLNREKCESLGIYETTPRFPYSAGKCGAWLFVHKAPFMLKEHVMTTKGDKIHFFFAKKSEFVTRQTFVHFSIPDKQHLHFSIRFIYFQSTVNQSAYNQLTENYDLLSLKRRSPVDSGFWSRICYYCSKKSRSKYNNQLTRNTPSCLVIAVVSKATVLEQPSSASSSYL